MKLVEILARELKEWPAKECMAISQDRNGYVYFWKTPDIECREGDWGSSSGHALLDTDWSCGQRDLAHDQATAIVTRAQWQEAREALSKPADFPSLAAKMCGIDMREDSKHSNLDNPPVGATHYIGCSEGIVDWWMREPGNNWYVWAWTAKHWALDTPSAGQKNLMKPIHESLRKKEWNGEGLPPVGTECEFKQNLLGWVKATITAITDKSIVFTRPIYRHAEITGVHEELLPHKAIERFRPIRTPEQIAAEERNAILAEMQRAVDCGSHGPQITLQNTLMNLYDAGYRKVKDGNQTA